MATPKQWRDRFIRAVGPWFIETVAARYSFEGLGKTLLKSKEAIRDRMLIIMNIPQYPEVTRHMIGIELWGQRRLKVALGEPLLADGHQMYRPPWDTSSVTLMLQFERARLDTVDLIPLLEAAQYSQKIPHNDLGPLSVKGWLYYLYLHGWLESLKLRSS